MIKIQSIWHQETKKKMFKHITKSKQCAIFTKKMDTNSTMFIYLVKVFEDMKYLCFHGTCSLMCEILNKKEKVINMFLEEPEISF